MKKGAGSTGAPYHSVWQRQDFGAAGFLAVVVRLRAAERRRGLAAVARGLAAPADFAAVDFWAVERLAAGRLAVLRLAVERFAGELFAAAGLAGDASSSLHLPDITR